MSWIQFSPLTRASRNPDGAAGMNGLARGFGEDLAQPDVLLECVPAPAHRVEVSFACCRLLPLGLMAAK
ncbi:MAG TPA: hypothetical protein VM686_36340, partial [Polyangiaceae bacterium]|nr:hypothetical protein [Polyangiaceae bacterium]